MVYPKMKGKHAEKPVFSTVDFARYRGKIGNVPSKKIPESIIVCYSSRLREAIHNVHKISELENIFGNYGKLYAVDGTNDMVALLTDFGIGAPATVLYMEEMMVWGARRFVILGTAGGISDKMKASDVVVCTRSIRDEGTSHHYVKHSKFAYPTKALTEDLAKFLAPQFSRLFVGPSWTIDAPYRETVKELLQYKKGGVLTVEMEASALFAVGKYKGVQTGAVFVVSDILSKKSWKPQFRADIVMRNLVQAFLSIKEVLTQ